MLSKLVSNIAAKKTVAGEEGRTDLGEMPSKQAFQALLQSLQNKGSSDKEKQQLMSLSKNLSEEGQPKGGEKRILGGLFVNVNAEKQVESNLLEKLQKKFQDIKEEYTGEQKTDSSDQEKANELDGVDEPTTDKPPKSGKEKQSQKIQNTTKERAASTDGNEQKESAEKAIVENVEKSVSGDRSTKTDLQDTAGKQEEHGASQSGKRDQAGRSKNVVEVTSSQQKDKDLSETGIGKANSDKEFKVRAGTDSKKTEVKKEIAGQTKSQLKSNGAISNKATANKDEPKDKNKVSGSQKSGLQARLNNQQATSLGKKMDEKTGDDSTPKARSLPHQNTQDEITKSGRASAVEPVKTEATEQQRKVVRSFVHQNRSTDVSQKGSAMKNIQTKESKKDDEKNSSSARRSSSISSAESRSKLLRRLGMFGAQASKLTKPADIQDFTGLSVDDLELSFQQQKGSLDEQLSENMTTQNEKETKSNSSTGSMRLGQLPISNASLRKKILPGLTKSIQKAVASARENADNWQKHSFTLDDGKNIQLSVRESNGVIQVKMGSMNLDLSKLLQQNLQQIREHLRQEFDANIDLQFENQQNEESGLSEDAESSDRKRNYRNSIGSSEASGGAVENMSSKRVRHFGYNQMEWTA